MKPTLLLFGTLLMVACKKKEAVVLPPAPPATIVSRPEKGLGQQRVRALATATLAAGQQMIRDQIKARRSIDIPRFDPATGQAEWMGKESDQRFKKLMMELAEAEQVFSLDGGPAYHREIQRWTDGMRMTAIRSAFPRDTPTENDSVEKELTLLLATPLDEIMTH